MKTASMPSLRVEPELRSAAEAVLREGESLSSFLEQSLRAQVACRQSQQAFVARGLAARDEARRTGTYHSATDVVKGLRRRLQKAESKGRS
jgi:hypothetical protein